MKRRRSTPEQVLQAAPDRERLLGESKKIPEATKELGISEETYHRWCNQYGGNEAKRLNELERENAQLKRIVAVHSITGNALPLGRDAAALRRRPAKAEPQTTALSAVACSPRSRSQA